MTDSKKPQCFRFTWVGPSESKCISEGSYSNYDENIPCIDPIYSECNLNFHIYILIIIY